MHAFSSADSRGLVTAIACGALRRAPAAQAHRCMHACRAHMHAMLCQTPTHAALTHAHAHRFTAGEQAQLFQAVQTHVGAAAAGGDAGPGPALALLEDALKMPFTGDWRPSRAC